MDDDKIKFIPQLTIDTEYFQREFANPCTMKNQRRSWSDVRNTKQYAIPRYKISNHRHVKNLKKIRLNFFSIRTDSFR
jgi:hypothetical protein